MNKKGNILYVQHAIGIGGSVISLKEIIIDSLIAGYRCAVICPNDIIASYYQSIGADTYVTRVVPFDHNTAFYYKLNVKDFLRLLRLAVFTFFSIVKVGRIARSVNPGLIHLNSSTLIFYALYFRAIRIPTILHVRENIVKGYFGIRKFVIRAIANKIVSHVIYISEFEFDLLQTRRDKSSVIYNYVHSSEFDNLNVDAKTSVDKFKLVTLGGLSKLKGGDVILEALSFLDQDIELNILGCEDPRVDNEKILRIEGRKYLSKIFKLPHDSRVSSKVKFCGRVFNPVTNIGLSNALIFWAAAPHFPRPVFEAWLLRKPVLYFNPGFQNKLINPDTVIMINGKSASEIGNAIKVLITSPVEFKRRCNRTYSLAMEHFTEKNFNKVDELYKRLIA